MDSITNYIVSVGGISRKARLLNITRDTALIELDGKTSKVTFLNKLGFDKQASILVNDKTHKIKLSKSDKSMSFNVEVDGKQFVLQVETRRRRLNRQASPASISFSHMLKRQKSVLRKEGEVSSLMPGKIVLLRVKVGDKVKAGDPLCVLEAMKMENEIVAPRDGTITQVKIDQGSIVKKSDILFTIE